MILLTFLFKLLLVLILLLVVLAAVLLLIPFYYYIHLECNEGMVLNFKVKWTKMLCLNCIYDNDTRFVSKLFIFSKEIILKSKNKAREDNKQNGKASEYKKHKKRKFKINDILDKDFLHQLMIFIKKVILVIKPEHLKINLLYGFDDPSITGSVLGFAYFLEDILPCANIDIQPVFDEATVDFKMTAGGKLIFGIILIESVKFLLKKDVRNKLKSLRKAETFS